MSFAVRHVMYVVAAFGFVVGAYAIHRLALWLEQRGWLYYRDRRASSSALGNAMLRSQAIVDPSAEHVLEERLREDVGVNESADPLDPGARRGADSK